MCNKYLKLIENEIKRYYKSFFEYDYEKIIMICLQTYEKFKEQNPSKNDDLDFRNALYRFILNLSFYLNERDFNKYIKVLKKNKIYKIKKSFRFFLRLQIYYYMIQEGNFNFIKNKSTKKKLQYYLDSSDNLITKFKKLFNSYLSLNYVELVITTKCTLRCRSCANLMYKYNKPYNVDLSIIKKSINKLLECCNEIKMFRILGGEPFCNPELKNILEELNSSKIKQIVIVTNGTIMPKDDDLIELLKNNKVVVEISDYNNLSSKKEKLIDFCAKNNIICHCGNFVRMWQDYGDLKKYKNNTEEQFFYCNVNCKNLLNGKLYYCPRQAHGIDLGIIKDNDAQYIDLIKNSKKTNQKLLKEYIFRNSPICACDYCKYATTKSNIIPVAEQIK